MLHASPDFSSARLAARMIPGISWARATGGTSIAKPNQSDPFVHACPGRTSSAMGRPLAAITSRPFRDSMLRGSMSIGVGLVPNARASLRDTVR